MQHIPRDTPSTRPGVFNPMLATSVHTNTPPNLWRTSVVQKKKKILTTCGRQSSHPPSRYCSCCHKSSVLEYLEILHHWVVFSATSLQKRRYAQSSLSIIHLRVIFWTSMVWQNTCVVLFNFLWFSKEEVSFGHFKNFLRLIFNIGKEGEKVIDMMIRCNYIKIIHLNFLPWSC